jgi:O-acetyl-ADP-ribose deacetylase (regulator of RNase III)
MARDPRITAIEGEITGLALDAIVNAANSSLLGGGGAGELLARCYRSSLSLAAAHGVRTIAFPAISSGAYGFPRGPACAIAVEETHRFVLTNDSLTSVVPVSLDQATAQLYNRALRGG